MNPALAMSIALALHVFAAVIWVGGMFFAHQILRPVAATQLEPPQRQALWVGVFSRFFPWVWVAIAVLFATGYWMIFGFYDGFGSVRPYVHTMHALALVMTGIYLYVFFAPYQGLKKAVAAQAWPDGKKHIDRIRTMVGINTIIGLLTIAVGAGGKYMS